MVTVQTPITQSAAAWSNEIIFLFNYNSQPRISAIVFY